ncbi:hypothetical protein CRUP_032055 [Coryphaenoides rupestris]|nr:hypothetical protein CRUP_032055 [Coryphaenoides rupestris]
MSQERVTGFPEEPRPPEAKGPMGMTYVPTDAETAVFKECNFESFWYRFAGFFGYLAGKMSYMSTCQEKFKRLDNSPLGDALRKRTGLPSLSQSPKTELSDPDTQSFSQIFQPVESNSQSQMPSSTGEQGYGYSAESSMQMERVENYNPPAPEPPVQSYVGDEEEPPRKPNILYEDLRSKNRENYEVTLTQKAEGAFTTPTVRERERSAPQKAVKKNIYGDSWDD